MRCEFSRHVLCQAVTLCESFAEPTAAKPVLGYVKFVIDRSRATLLASNRDSQVEHTIPVISNDRCSFLVDAKILSKLLRQCDADQIVLTSSSDTSIECITVHNHADEFQLCTLNEELPTLPSLRGKAISVPSALLERIKTLLISTDDESRSFALSGVCLEFQAGTLHAISTDGRRLSRYTTPVDTNLSRSLIVPSSLCAKLPKLASVQMRANETMVEFSSAQTKIIGRLVDGRFPNWRKVYDWDHSPAAKRTIDRAAFLSAMKRTMLVTDSDSPGIQIEITGRSMILKAASASVGKSSVQLDCDEMQGNDQIAVTLDGNYILEPLATATGDTVEFWWDAPSSAVAIDFDGVQYVLMPMSR